MLFSAFQMVKWMFLYCGRKWKGNECTWNKTHSYMGRTLDGNAFGPTSTWVSSPTCSFSVAKKVQINFVENLKGFSTMRQEVSQRGFCTVYSLICQSE